MKLGTRFIRLGCAVFLCACIKDPPPVQAPQGAPPHEPQAGQEHAAPNTPNAPKEQEPPAEPAQAAPLSPSPGGNFDFLRAFEKERERFLKATPDDLAALAPRFTKWSKPKAQPKYWERIVSPARHGQAQPALGLNDEERAALDANGFVVTNRLGSTTFAHAYHRIYELDQPVFITADSVLHAWHMSYDAMLEALETSYMRLALQQVLEGM